jgi:hypothetical protein
VCDKRRVVQDIKQKLKKFLGTKVQVQTEQGAQQRMPRADNLMCLDENGRRHGDLPWEQPAAAAVPRPRVHSQDKARVQVGTNTPRSDTVLIFTISSNCLVVSNVL